MDLTSYLAVARRWWWTLLVATWVAAIAGFLVASRITPTYEAQVQLLVGPINSDSDTLKASALLVQTYGQLAISPPLIRSTAQEAGGIDPIKLAQNVRSSANDATRILAIRVQDADPAKAAEIANTMADELIQLTTGSTTRPEGHLEVISAASPPTAPVAPQVPLVVLFAMVAGFLSSLVLVVLVEYVIDAVRDRADLVRLAGVDVLATIAFPSRRPGIDPMPMPEAAAPGSAMATAFRVLASKIAFAEASLATRTITVIGIGDGDSGVVATGLASVAAGSGYRAALIDGAANGDITASLGLGEHRGIREAAAGVPDVRSLFVTSRIGVEVLPSGGAGARDVVSVDRATEILGAIRQGFDIVIIDGGAISHSPGALTWARAAQRSILLVRAGASHREDVRLAVESLKFVKATLVGTVLLQRSPRRSFGRSDQAPSPALAPTDPMLPRAHDSRAGSAEMSIRQTGESRGPDDLAAPQTEGAAVPPLATDGILLPSRAERPNPARRRQSTPEGHPSVRPATPVGQPAWQRPEDAPISPKVSPRTRRAD